VRLRQKERLFPVGQSIGRAFSLLQETLQNEILGGFSGQRMVFHRNASARGWCWRIKKGQPSRPDCPRKRHKKAEYPYIGHSAVKKVRLTLYQVERFTVKATAPLSV